MCGKQDHVTVNVSERRTKEFCCGVQGLFPGAFFSLFSFGMIFCGSSNYKSDRSARYMCGSGVAQALRLRLCSGDESYSCSARSANDSSLYSPPETAISASLACNGSRINRTMREETLCLKRWCPLLFYFGEIGFNAPSAGFAKQHMN